MLTNSLKNPSWLYSVDNGATTIWEDWDGPTSDNGKGGGIASLNHYSKGAVCEWVFDEMCGVKIAGENHFVIAPHPGGSFTHAEFSYDSCYGTVASAWKKKDNGDFVYTIIVPSNCTAKVVLPDGRMQQVEAGTYSF